MTNTRDDVAAAKTMLLQAEEAVGTVVLGKREQIRMAWIGLLAGGHLLIEDLPGTGKTTLAHALASVTGLEFRRIQFTSDLLPADVIGGAVFENSTESFVFHPGPVFTQMLLADEINRATPKTQSALLEAMEERQVTVDGETRALPEPFFVIATQNPSHQIGTYPLPESQLDRFLMKVTLGYPSPEDEKTLLLSLDQRRKARALDCILPKEELLRLQLEVDGIKVSDTLAQYVLDLLLRSRTDTRCEHGLSPRAGVMLIRAARARALFEGRDFVLPEDVQALMVPVASHRLMARGGVAAEELVQEWLETTPVPL
jgi:MoxR-like ATPase